MNAQRWQEIRAGFDEIVDLDPGARAGRLAALADSDPSSIARWRYYSRPTRKPPAIMER